MTLDEAIAQSTPYNPAGDCISREALQGEYETACNVLLSLEQIVRKSEGWEDSAVEAVHNAVQTAIKCMHERPQGDCISREYIESIVRAEFVDLQDGTEEWRTCVNDTCEDILIKVHNAPTVEYTFEEAFQKTVCENRLYCPARQKGEWIFRKGVTCGGYYKCNKCGEVERAEKNYCPNCGALMKGGTE